tara:strand:+ start:3375 stop:4319 length:945 start_codon:yes stop_codon:yes gene_type:complete
MKNVVLSLLLGFALLTPSVADEAKINQRKAIAEHLQNISVTIRAESNWGAGEGSGVIFTRKDSDGNLVNFVWTAAHVVDILRTERKVVIGGVPKVKVEFKDALIVKEIRQNGRTVGRLQMDAEVLKYSDATNGHDLALLRIRKLNFISDTVVFDLSGEIPSLGTELLHVGSLLGQMGANSMTDGIYSQHGRLIKSLNKYVFDQTTVTAFPGSSGGGVYLKSNSKYTGMLVRGAGEGFNLIVPVRRMVNYCKEHDIMWALDPKKEMPTYKKLLEMPIENTPHEEKEDTEEEAAAKKMFPFMLRVIHPKILILERK